MIDQPYAAAHWCAGHFRATVEDRVRRELHHQAPRFPGGTIVVGLSGGKDSATALALTQRYFHRRPNVRIVAVSVDEGIAGYRPATLSRAGELASRLGIEHRVVRTASELGVSTDEVAGRLSGRPPCSYCGVWRRTTLNRTARALGAQLLVLGFNLDDLAQTVLMNFARADLARLGRMAPHRSRQPGLVPRIAPLALIPEREVFLYAQLTGLPFDHGECPHAAAAARNVFREAVWRLEEALPGTRQGLLRAQRGLAPLLAEGPAAGRPGRCVNCGEPASGLQCRACAFLAEAKPPSGELPSGGT